MREITPAFIMRDYDQIKRKAIKSVEKQEFDDAFILISTAAEIAYSFNFRYADDELEGLIEKISCSIFTKGEFAPEKNRVVLYDCFSLDNRGLTQQYLRSLKEWDVDFLYIMESPHNKKYATDILTELSNIRGAELFFVPSSLGRVETARAIRDKIIEYAPEKAFLHLAPWSALAVCIWNSLPQITRYFIDLTDHAFWLGKCCSDYFIGWRDYGYVVSTMFRGISPKAMLQLTYYPVVKDDSVFLGFPEITKNKTIIFSGGAYYKIYGENGLFFEILKKISNDNPSCIVLFAGSGDDTPFRNFIKANHLEDRILLIGNRRDINQVVAHCDIYLNTYPFIGGLMSQYAVLNLKPVIGYSPKDIPFNFAEGIFLKSDSIKFTFNDLDSFHREMSLLIHDLSYRINTVKNYPHFIPTPEQFASELRRLIVLGESNNVSREVININKDRFMGLYLEVENKYLKSYHLSKFKLLKLRYFKLAPLDAMLSLMDVLRHQHKFLVAMITKKVKSVFRV